MFLRFCSDVSRGESAESSQVEVTASRTWSHPFADVHASATAISTVLLAGIGDGVRGVARLIEIRRRTAKLTGAGVLPLQAVEVEAGSGRLVLRTTAFTGITVAELLERGPLPGARVVTILGGVARALAAAHREGLLHRALGPASVLVDPQDQVRVLDFGVGELLEKNTPSSSLRLQPFTPERVLGLPRSVAEDIYLLGCLGHLLATGEPPLVDDDVEHLRRRHVIEDPPRLASAPGLRVPLRLARAIDRCLAKDAEDRFADVDELLIEIDAAAAELRVPPRKPIAPPVLTAAARRSIPAPPVIATAPVVATPPVVAAPPVVTPPPVIVAPPVVVAPPLVTAPHVIVAATSSTSRPIVATRSIPRGRARGLAIGVAFISVLALAVVFWPSPHDDAAPAREDAARMAVQAEPSAPVVAGAQVEPTAVAAPQPTVGAVAPHALAVPIADEPALLESPDAEVLGPGVVAPEVSELLATAKVARQQGRRTDAMRAYQEVAAIDPGNAEALGALARISFDRADFRDAVQWGKRAVAASPRSGKARLALGDAYFKLGKRSEAEAQYRRASSLGHELAERRLAMLAAR